MYLGLNHTIERDNTHHSAITSNRHAVKSIGQNQVYRPNSSSVSLLGLQGYLNSLLDRLQDKDSLMAWDYSMDLQGAQSQKEGQEDQGTLTDGLTDGPEELRAPRG